MELYFLRHELAGDREDWMGDDRKRPLTDQGKKRMAESAKTLDSLSLGLDAILTSPLARACQTAEIAAEGLGLEKVLAEDERLAPGFNPEALAQILKDHSRAKALMLVGHEPDFSETVSAITGGSEILFKKGGLARVDLTDIAALKGQLAWLIPPKILSRSEER